MKVICNRAGQGECCRECEDGVPHESKAVGLRGDTEIHCCEREEKCWDLGRMVKCVPTSEGEDPT